MSTKIEHTPAYLKRRLKAAADPRFRESQQRFFTEPVRCIGVRTPDIRKLAGQAASEYRSLLMPIEKILDIGEKLWVGGILDERALALEIAGRFKRQLDKAHWKRFDGWIDTLSNWADTDGLCLRVLTPILTQRRELISRVTRWTRSGNLWRRRAAAVALVPLARNGEELDAAFEICERLAADREDLVEKAVGWLLKEASRTEPEAVVDFMLRDIGRFSRTTVRYACEKLPKRVRARVMTA